MTLYVKNNRFALWHIKNHDGECVVDFLNEDILSLERPLSLKLIDPKNAIDILTKTQKDLCGFKITYAVSYGELNGCLDLMHPDVLIDLLDINHEDFVLDEKHAHRVKALCFNVLPKTTDMLAYMRLERIHIHVDKESCPSFTNTSAKVFAQVSNKPGTKLLCKADIVSCDVTTFCRLYENTNVTQFNISDRPGPMFPPKEYILNCFKKTKAKVEIIDVETKEFMDALEDMDFSNIGFNLEPYKWFFLEIYLGKQIDNITKEDRPEDLLAYVREKTKGSIVYNTSPYIQKSIQEFKDCLLVKEYKDT